MIYTTTSPQQTSELAVCFASELSAGDVVCLHGDLGAGKTLFTKGLALGLGVDETVTSPTFTIVSEYRSGRVPLFHFDVYRLGSSEGLEDTAFFDYVGSEGIVVIEWAEFIEDVLRESVHPDKRVDITITSMEDCAQTRQIRIQRGTL